MKSDKSEIIIYQTEDGVTKIDVQMVDETIWLSIDQMAKLFQRDKSTISRHIKNIYEEGELNKNSVVANFATTAADGKTYQVDYYNLDVIISVGYRVKSLRGTQFRRWAMEILREYLIHRLRMTFWRVSNGHKSCWKARPEGVKRACPCFLRHAPNSFQASFIKIAKGGL